MTRINIGVSPSELCDQHLIAECCKELPRLFKYIDNPPTKRVPKEFKLGTGHELFCGSYMQTIVARYNELMDELAYRGFNSNYSKLPVTSSDQYGKTMCVTQQKRARPILIERINNRLTNMLSNEKKQFHPRWTKRTPPQWAVSKIMVR